MVAAMARARTHLSPPPPPGQARSLTPAQSLSWIRWRELVSWQHLLLSGTKAARLVPHASWAAKRSHEYKGESGLAGATDGL